MAWHAGSRWVTVDGRRAHVVDAGEGPAVLLLHGILHSSWTWRETVARLAGSGYRVIAPCLPGFGWSDVETGDVSLPGITRWLLQLLDGLGVGQLRCAVGNSLGGGICLSLAHAAPERVERLALVSPLGAFLPVPSLPLRLLSLKPLNPIYQLTAGQPAFVRRLLQLTAYRRVTVDDEVLRGFAHLSRPGGQAAAVAHAAELWSASTHLSRILPELRVPSLLVWGDCDRLLPLGYGRAIAARLPGARLSVFEGTGHCAQEEDPVRFLAELRRWLVSEPDTSGEGPVDDGPADTLAA